MTDGSTTWNYTYNADGLRTKRTNGTTTYNYVYNGDKLSQMTIVDVATGAKEIVDLAYDAGGTPMTLTYTAAGATASTTYYYVTNIQGDVVGLTDSQGTLLIRYAYEAYGKGYYASYDTTQAALLARINPLGYRGYVLDTGTNLYYLQSRYYNPEVGRFINADGLVSTGQGLVGNNMFAYCGNNPVSRIDASGHSWVAIVIGIVIGAGVGVATSWIGSAVTGQAFSWRDAGVAAICGGISSLGTPGLVAGGILNGLYTGYTVYEDGGNLLSSFASGALSSLFSMISFGDLAQAGTDLANIAISGFVDFVFGTGFSSMDSAISKTMTENNRRNSSSASSRSALDVVMRNRQISATRIYNGRTVIVGSKNCCYPGGRYDDPNRVYCYVFF